MSFFIYLLHVTAALAIFYGFYLMFLQKQTTFATNRFYLISSILAALIIPLIRIYFESQTGFPVEIPAYVFMGSYFETTVVAAPSTSVFPWTKVGLMIYGTGVVVMLLRLVIEFQKIRLITKRGQLILSNGNRCIISEQVNCPYSFMGTIYLPADHGFSDKELAEVIRHEHAHIAGRHSVDVLFIEVVTIFLWISPVIYLYRNKLREVHEFLADAAVIQTSPWAQYAELLISQKNIGLQNKLSNQLVYSQLKKRLIMMTQKPSSSWSRMRYLGFLPLLLIAVIIFSFRQKHAPVDHENKIAFDEKQRLLSAEEEATSDHGDSKQVYNIYKDGLKMYTNPEMPLFPGCENVWSAEKQACSQEKLVAYISKELVYPSALKAGGIEGNVIVKFVVDAKGYITKSWIERSLHPAANEAALNLINGMNAKAGRWTPAMKDGKAIDMEMSLPISFKLAAEEHNDVYTYVDPMPSFPGSTQDMYAYIYKTIRYPEEDRRNGIQGTVIVQFIVLPDGSLSGIKVVRSKSPTLDAEAIRVTEGMNNLPERWTPGYKDGKPVAVMFTLPIKFVLQSKDQDQPPTLTVTEELKYYVNSNEVPAAMLEGALENAVKRSQVPTVVLHIAKSLTVQDLVNVMTIAERLNLRMVLSTDTPIIHAEEKKATHSVHDTRSQKSIDNAITVYPNPTNGIINVDLFHGAHLLQILDQTGKVVMTKSIDKNQTKAEVETQSLPPGYYVLHVISDKATKSMQFIKSN